MTAELAPIEVGPIQQMQTLRRLFGSDNPVSAPALAAIARLTAAVRIPAGTHMEHEAGADAVVYFVIEGALRASSGGKAWGVFGPRTTVGLLAAMSRDSRAFECTALADSVALTIRAEDLLEVLEDHFELMHSSLRRLAGEGIELRRLLPSAGFSNSVSEGFPCPVRPMDLVERILCLRRAFALEVGYIDELAQIARAAEEVRYDTGTPLWSGGDPATHSLILVCGVVQGTTSDGAVFRLGPGDFLGNLDTVAGKPRWFDARVTQPVVALKLNSEVMVDVLEDHSELAFDFLRMVARMMISLREQVAELRAAEGRPS